MIMYMKLGTGCMKRFETKEYKSIEVNDQIDVLVNYRWQNVKIWKIDDDIPMRYFGELL